MLVAQGKQSTEGCLTIDHSAKEITSPHSTTLVDLDGDCISDLFMTVKDKHTGEEFYEIYLRRERAASIAVDDNEE
jgi:hypothetical protein